MGTPQHRPTASLAAALKSSGVCRKGSDIVAAKIAVNAENSKKRAAVAGGSR